MTREVSKGRISDRAERVWGKLQDWYGDKFDQYGPQPPEDWRLAIDAMDAALERKVLPEVRLRHPCFPPTFPEFEAIIKRTRAASNAGPSIVERLDAYVMSTRHPTFMQRRSLQWLGSGENVIGVVVPEDGDRPGFKVMVSDLPQEFAQ